MSLNSLFRRSALEDYEFEVSVGYITDSNTLCYIMISAPPPKKILRNCPVTVNSEIPVVILDPHKIHPAVLVIVFTIDFYF